MDYLQYTMDEMRLITKVVRGFKPYYKWITFNTLKLALM